MPADVSVLPFRLKWMTHTHEATATHQKHIALQAGQINQANKVSHSMFTVRCSHKLCLFSRAPFIVAFFWFFSFEHFGWMKLHLQLSRTFNLYLVPLKMFIRSHPLQRYNIRFVFFFFHFRWLSPNCLCASFSNPKNHFCMQEKFEFALGICFVYKYKIKYC